MEEQVEVCARETEHMKQNKASLQAFLKDNYTKLLKKDLSTLASAQKENLSLVWIVKSIHLLGDEVHSS